MLVSKPVRWLLYSVAGFLLVLLAIAATLVARFQPIARDYVISALKQRYKSDVELGDLRISLFPAVHATADNLVLRFGGRADLPPMVRIRRLTLDAGFVGFFRSPKRISRLKLEGLEITTPPKSAGRARHTEGGGRLSEPGAIFVLDEVDADSAVLSTTPSDPQPSGPSKRDPLVFRIHQLTMHSVGIGLPMTFHAKWKIRSRTGSSTAKATSGRGTLRSRAIRRSQAVTPFGTQTWASSKASPEPVLRRPVWR